HERGAQRLGHRFERHQQRMSARHPSHRSGAGSTRRRRCSAVGTQPRRAGSVGPMSDWPKLVVDEGRDTRGTLHLWTQIVGKVRMAFTPAVNHWWHVPLYVSSRGLTTSLIPYGPRGFEMVFDFCAHQLHIDTSDPDRRSVALEPKSVAVFYEQTM